MHRPATGEKKERRVEKSVGNLPPLFPLTVSQREICVSKAGRVAKKEGEEDLFFCLSKKEKELVAKMEKGKDVVGQLIFPENV